MKKFVYVLGIAMIAISCSVDDVIDELSPEMTAKIDGVSWQANVQYSTLKDNQFVITGTALSGKIIAITTFGITEDTYKLDLENVKFYAAYKESANSSTEDAYPAVNGTVVLTDVNTSKKVISGTFNFTARQSSDITNEISITEGKFKDLKYTEETE